MKRIKHSDNNFPIENINDINIVINQRVLMVESMGIKPDYYREISIFGQYDPIPLKYNYVDVKKSDIHGIGLFATDDVPIDVIVTYYPAHFININQKILSDDDIPIDIESWCYIYSLYLSFDDKLSIIGNPNRIDNTLLLGHIINDAVGNAFRGINMSETTDISKFKNIVAQYYIEGSKKANCKFILDDNKKVISVVTTKSIKKDDELLALYDPIYWFNINYNMTNTNDNHAIKYLRILSADKNFNAFMNKYCNNIF